MLDTLIEEVKSVELTDLSLEELAGLDASNENPTKDNSDNPDIVALLKDVYAGVGRAKLEAKYKIDLGSLLGENIGNQSSWKGRAENANALIANYTSSLSSTGAIKQNSTSNKTLDDIVSLQQEVAQDFKAKEKRIAAYHERKHNDTEYVSTVSTSISQVIDRTTKFKEKGGEWSVATFETPKINELHSGLPLVPLTSIEPLDEPKHYRVGGNPEAIKKAKKETPLLLYDSDANNLQLNLEEKQKVRRAGMGILAAGLALAATVVLSADILALGNVCSNYIGSRVPTSITYNFGWPESNPTASFMTLSDDDPIGTIIAQTMQREEVPAPDIEYRTLAQLEEEATFGGGIAGTDSANLSVVGFRAGDELSRRMAMLDVAEEAAEGAYNLGERVRKTRVRSPHFPTLVNVPDENGGDERLVIIAEEGYNVKVALAEGQFIHHNPTDYAIARLPGFNDLSFGVRDSLMGSFDPDQIILTSDPFYSQDTVGNLVAVRACNGKWESRVLSQRDLAYHTPGAEILSCDLSI